MHARRFAYHLSHKKCSKNSSCDSLLRPVWIPAGRPGHEAGGCGRGMEEHFWSLLPTAVAGWVPCAAVSELGPGVDAVAMLETPIPDV